MSEAVRWSFFLVGWEYIACQLYHRFLTRPLDPQGKSGSVVHISADATSSASHAAV